MLIKFLINLVECGTGNYLHLNHFNFCKFHSSHGIKLVVLFTELSLWVDYNIVYTFMLFRASSELLHFELKSFTKSLSKAAFTLDVKDSSIKSLNTKLVM